MGGPHRREGRPAPGRDASRKGRLRDEGAGRSTKTRARGLAPALDRGRESAQPPEAKMRPSARHSLVFGVLAICVSSAVAAATISSPYRGAGSGSPAMKRAAPGEQRLELDQAALAALRGSGAGPVEVTDFPTAPGTTSRVVLRRFEIVSPEARIRVTGPEGDSFRAFPSIAHFSGKVQGEPDSMVYVSAHEDKLVALVSSSAGVAYIGPDESKTGFVVATPPLPPTTFTPGTPGPASGIRCRSSPTRRRRPRGQSPRRRRSPGSRKARSSSRRIRSCSPSSPATPMR